MKLGIFWAPLCVLGYLAASYLLECFDWLSAPGKPLVVRLPTRSGPIVLRAESYALDVSAGLITGRDLRLLESNGLPIANAEALQVQMPWFGGGQAVRVQLKGAHAVIERDEDGNFSFENYLPEQTQEPSETPYDVQIEDATVQVVDRAGGSVWSRTYEVSSLQVDGLGDRFVASAKLRQIGGGRIGAAARKFDAESFQLDLQLDGLDLAPLLARVQAGPLPESWQELRKARAGSLTLDGNYTLNYGPEQGLAVFGAGSASGRAISFDEYSAETGTWVGRFDGKTIIGDVSLVRSGVRAEATGSGSWGEAQSFAAKIRAEAPNKSSLPRQLSDFLPKEVRFAAGTFDGSVQAESGQDPYIDGRITAKTIQYATDSLSNVDADVNFSNGEWLVDLNTAEWQGAKLDGAVQKSRVGDGLRGYLTANGVRLGQVGSRFDFQGLEGVTQVSAELGGTLDEPRIELRAKGDALYTSGSQELSLSAFQAAADWTPQGLVLREMSGQFAGGRLVASGTVDIEKRRLNIDLFVGAAQLQEVHADLKGTAAMQAKLAGRMDNPQLIGNIELFAASYSDYEVPFVTAEVAANRSGLEARSVRASRSASTVKGNARWDFGTDALSGSLTASGVELEELFGKDFAGVVSAPSVILGGTFEKPEASFTLSATNLIVYGAKIESGAAQGRWIGSEFSIDRAEFSDGFGSVVAQGVYNLESKEGTLSAQASGLDLRQALPALPGETVVGGSVGGDFFATFRAGALQSLTATGDVSDLAVNPSHFGSGSWTLNFAEGRWNASTQIGTIERYLEAENFTFDQATREVSGQLAAYGMPIEDIYLALRPNLAKGEGEDGKQTRWAELPQGVLNQLDTLSGSLDASIRISGTDTDPNISVETAVARGLQVAGVESGTASAKVSRSKGIWDVSELFWQHGAARLAVNGTIDENGDTVLDGNIDNIDTEWLQNFIPSIGVLQGEIGSVAFLVSGPTRDPVVSASASATFLKPVPAVAPAGAASGTSAEAEAPPRDTSLKVNLYEITLSNSGASFGGSLSYLGFKGSLRGDFPFSFPFEMDRSKPISLVVDLPDRDLRELDDLLPSLDTERTSGKIGGRLSLSGNLDKPLVDGYVLSSGAELALKGATTSLTNADLAARLDNGGFSLTLHANGSREGTMEAEARMAFQDIAKDIEELLAFATSGRPAPALDVSGHVSLSEFGVAEDKGQKGGRVSARADGRVDLGGTFREPSLTTSRPVQLTRISARAPEEFPEGGGPYTGRIDPKIAIDLAVGSRDVPVTLDASNGTFRFDGQGRITGSFGAPTVDANFIVRSGSIRLPTARVQIEEGGAARFHYVSTGASYTESRLDVDLNGKTNLTALAPNGIIERYDVNLRFTGDLLSESALTMSAQSDPPGLAEDRILALLGQGGVFESVGQNRAATDFQRQVRTALTGFAFPMLLDPFTQQLSRDIGLDYLSLEYNAYEGTVLTAGKTLGKGFGIQYRRQIAEGPDGILHYDLRLTFRPFAKNRLLRNVFLSVGADQTRPWKISLEYGTRY